MEVSYSHLRVKLCSPFLPWLFLTISPIFHPSHPSSPTSLTYPPHHYHHLHYITTSPPPPLQTGTSPRPSRSASHRAAPLEPSSSSPRERNSSQNPAPLLSWTLCDIMPRRMRTIWSRIRIVILVEYTGRIDCRSMAMHCTSLWWITSFSMRSAWRWTRSMISRWEVWLYWCC